MAASNAARMIRAGGGFTARMEEELMTSQVQLYAVADPARAVAGLEAHREELLALAAAAVPNLIRRDGGPQVRFRVLQSEPTFQEFQQPQIACLSGDCQRIPLALFKLQLDRRGEQELDEAASLVGILNGDDGVDQQSRIIGGDSLIHQKPQHVASPNKPVSKLCTHTLSYSA